MQNPGAKVFSPEPFIKVTYRRTAAPPPMAAPKTMGGGYTVPPEPETLKENVQTAPPTTGAPHPMPVPATNGAEPILDYKPISATPQMPDPNKAADQRRMDTQKQVGGGEKENPSYDRAQQGVRNKMQQRQNHPLHQAMFDEDDYWSGSDYPVAEECPSCGSPNVDGAPGNSHCFDCGHTDTPRENFGPLQTREFSVWDHAPLWEDHGKPGMEEKYPGSGKRILDDVRRGPGDITPLDMQRMNSTHQSSYDDPVYPYNPRSNPEHDTVDLDNLQSGDDTYSPVRPERSDPRLRQINEVLDTANQGNDEDQRGADANASAINMLFGLGEGSLEDHKKAIDKYVDNAVSTHKDRVKALHDDWLARGGHATGEPRPVYKFSPRYTKPQQIVPDPSNPFPELTSPIYMAGKCEGCGKKLYDSADSSGDPRGALGDNTYSELRPQEFGDYEHGGMHGKPLAICPGCENDQDRYNMVVDKGKGHKAGEKTGGGYWGVPFGSPVGTKREFIPTTYGKDRKGKWHNPGEQLGSCPECGPDNGLQREGVDRSPGQHQDAYSRYTNRVFARQSHVLHQAHHDPDQDIKDVLAVQGSPGNWDYDPYMHGMFNGMELVGAIHDGRDPEFKEAPGHWRSSEAALIDTYIDSELNLRHFRDTDYRPDEEGYFTAQPMIEFKRSDPSQFMDSPYDYISDSSPNCETCWVKHGRVVPEEAHDKVSLSRHRFKPFSTPIGERLASLTENQWDIHNNLRYFHDTDFRPPHGSVDAEHPMIEFKRAEPFVEGDMEHPYRHTSDPNCETCWMEDGDVVPRDIHDRAHGFPHPFKPFSTSVGERSAASRKKAETDEEFWARQPDVVRDYHPTGPDLTGQSFTDEDYNPDRYDPESWSDADWDDMVPENMSLRDHSHLLRSGLFDWDGDSRYPRYTRLIHRNIVDASGEPAFEQEGHVIEHNTRNRGPVLPSADNPEPHVLQYPWSHTYYPAGVHDNRALTRGYNTVDQVTHASNQLALMGARHPASQELLKDYHYLGDEEPYDPGVELPHEAAQRMSRHRVG